MGSASRNPGHRPAAVSTSFRALVALAMVAANVALPWGAARAIDTTYSGTWTVHIADVPDLSGGPCPTLADVPDVSGTLTFTVGAADAAGQPISGTITGSGSASRHYTCHAYNEEWDQSATVSVSGPFSTHYDPAAGTLEFSTDSDLTWTHHVVRTNCVRFTSDADLAPCQGPPDDHTTTDNLIFKGTVAGGGASGSTYFGEITTAGPDGSWSASGSGLGASATPACEAPKVGNATDTSGCNDVAVDHIEVVQVVQDPQDSIPLVAGKKTVVRVFYRTTGLPTGTSVPVDVRLTGVRDGTLLADPPPSRHTSIKATATPDRSTDDATVTFTLPATWTADGDLELEAFTTVDPSVKDTTPEDDDKIQSVTFTDRPALGIVWAPICINDSVKTIDCADENLDSVVEAWQQTLLSVYPVADNSLQIWHLALPSGAHSKYTLHYPGTLASPADQSRLLVWLQSLLDLARSWATTGDVYLDQFIGLVANDADKSGFGGASTPSTGGHVAYIDDFNVGWGMAHEIGHNLGLNHLQTDDSTCSQAGAPFDPGPTAIGEVGYDPSIHAVVGPTAKDFMSYCSVNRWVSPAHYRSLNDTGMVPPHPLAPKAGVSATGSAGRSDFIVTGVIGADGSGSLDPAFTGPASAGGEPPSSGPACVAASGGSGPTATACFTPEFTNQESGQQQDAAPFLVHVPDPAGTTTLTLTYNGATLATLAAAATRPTVDAASHAGETWTAPTTLSWTVNAAPAARTAVIYSGDGGRTWWPFAGPSADSSITVDPHELIAGAGNLFRVLVTDGVATTSADIGPINVPPTVGRMPPPLPGVAATTVTGPTAAPGPTASPAAPALAGIPVSGDDTTRWLIVAGLLLLAAVGAVVVFALVRGMV